MKRVFLVDCVAPIPIGHAVEVRVMKEPKKGFLSRRVDAKYQPKQPWVKDLDTGVEYAVLWQYSDAAVVHMAPGTEYPERLRGDLEEVERVTGEVVSCRVLTLPGGENWKVQTRLELEV
jgi:hypothetical protein